MSANGASSARVAQLQAHEWHPVRGRSVVCRRPWCAQPVAAETEELRLCKAHLGEYQAGPARGEAYVADRRHANMQPQPQDETGLCFGPKEAKGAKAALLKKSWNL